MLTEEMILDLEFVLNEMLYEIFVYDEITRDILFVYECDEL